MNDLICDYMRRYRWAFRVWYNQWAPETIQFRQLAYAHVKLSSWGQFDFQLLDEKEYSKVDEEYNNSEFQLQVRRQGLGVPGTTDRAGVLPAAETPGGSKPAGGISKAADLALLYC
jgi:hypothetical protein